MGEIKIPKPHENLLLRVQNLLAQYDDIGHAPVLALPTLAWMLPLLKVASPVYDLYCVYPARAGEQERMKAEVQAAQPKIVILDKRAVLGGPPGGIADTHPVFIDWLLHDFCKDWQKCEEFQFVDMWFKTEMSIQKAANLDASE